MLQVTRRVVSLAKTKFSGCLSALSNAHYSACCPSKVKEAPLLDNECVLSLPEETKARNNLETTIMAPVMVDLSPVSGFPDHVIRTRLVRIFQPVKNAMQSGTNNIGHWEVEFDNRMRWENSNMGWTSTGDPHSRLRLRFSQPNEAIDYCNRNGWMWYVDVPLTDDEFRPKDYGHNFSWNRRSRVSTK